MQTIERCYHWPDGKSLTIGKKTLVMGILNVTPDSFSDGGRWNTLEQARVHALEMVRDGADIIDIGAESSQPGFVPVSAAEECERLLPFLEKLLPKLPVPVSVDTFKAQTAAAALELGAHILNDIQGLQYADEPGKMAAVAVQYGVPVIAMHNHAGTQYQGDILAAMRDFFRETLRIARQAGLPEDQLIFDPGIGFGKTPEGNLQVLRRLAELQTIDGKVYPWLLGVSRKSFIGAALDLPVGERLEATGAASIWGVLQGCSILRVHDVKPMVRMCRMLEAIREA